MSQSMTNVDSCPRMIRRVTFLAACVGAVVLLVSTLGAAAATVSSRSAAAPNLIQNGGFEQPVVHAGRYRATSWLPGWSSIGPRGGDVAIVSRSFVQARFRFPAQSGQQWLDLTGGTGTYQAGIVQTVKTSKGTSYTLRFWVGNVVNRGGIFGVKSSVAVDINGNQVLLATNTNGAGRASQNWKAFSVSFVATSAATSVAFLNEDSTSDQTNGLDSVTLTAG